MITRCICSHSGQDAIHGEGFRVANQTKDPDKVRCTVCKLTIDVRHQTVLASVQPKPKAKSKKR